MNRKRSRSHRSLCCLIVTLVAVHSVCSADKREITVEEFVKARMERDRTKQRAVRENFRPLLKADPHRAFEALIPYRNDPSDETRSEMLRYMMIVKAKHSGSALDQKLVRTLLELYIERYGERGKLMRSDALRYLPRFRRSCFDDDAKNLIRSAFREKDLSKDTLQLYSIANMKEDLPELKKAFAAKEWPSDDPDDEMWHAKLKWTFRRVMAQFGDEESIAYCVSRVEKEERPGAKVKAMLSLEKVRHPDVVRLMEKCLETDLRVDGGHGMSWPVSACAVQVLAGMLDNFPVKKKSAYPMHSESETAKCRKWMAEQTEWKIRRP